MGLLDRYLTYKDNSLLYFTVHNMIVTYSTVLGRYVGNVQNLSKIKLISMSFVSDIHVPFAITR